MRRTGPLIVSLASFAIAAACGSGSDPSALHTYRIRRIADSTVARTGHVAIALADGSALVMGGNTSESINVPDAETTQRFDPVTETFSPGPPLAFSALDQEFTIPVALRNGAFLLVGGGINSGTPLQVPSPRLTQLFDPVRGAFARTGDLNVVRSGDAAAALLGDGRVLVAGGGFPAATFAELYDPSAARWASTGDLRVARRGHTATALGDGRVLIAGGVVCCDASGEIFTDAAELYDPVTGTFQLTGKMGLARGFHRATRLADGRVLLTGGFAPTGPRATDAAAQSEVFDPATGMFSSAGSLQIARVGHQALLLPDGRALVVGGSRDGGSAGIAVTELFDPARATWMAGPSLDPAWAGSTATLLGNGKVLLFGGEDPAGFPRPDAFLLE